VIPWEQGGETSLANCVMVCRACHRLIHHAGWDVRLVDGRPEFYPPPWIDHLRRARRRPPHFPDAVRAPSTADPAERPARGRVLRQLVNSSCATGRAMGRQVATVI